MDFVIYWPKFDNCDTIIVVMDRILKYVIFMPASPRCITKKASKLFVKNIVKF